MTVLVGKAVASSKRAKPALPRVAVTIRKQEPTPSQAASWFRLWSLLLEPDKRDPAGSGRQNQGCETEVVDGEIKPPTTE